MQHPEQIRVAVPIGKYKGRRFYRVPVRIVIVNTRTLSERSATCTVIAPSAADAANLVRDEFATVPCCNIYATGPRGAIVKRYVGYESAIAAMLWQRPRDMGLQLALPLGSCHEPAAR